MTTRWVSGSVPIELRDTKANEMAGQAPAKNLLGFRPLALASRG